MLRRHLAAGVECYDIEPGNFVFRVDPRAGSVEVKMIDFGIPHCLTGRERNCARATQCAVLDPRGRVLFVALAAQLLFSSRATANMGR